MIQLASKFNIVDCVDPDKDAVLARIKSRGSITRYIGGIDDYEVYPNGYASEIKSISRNKSGIMRNFDEQ